MVAVVRGSSNTYVAGTEPYGGGGACAAAGEQLATSSASAAHGSRSARGQRAAASACGHPRLACTATRAPRAPQRARATRATRATRAPQRARQQPPSGRAQRSSSSSSSSRSVLAPDSSAAAATSAHAAAFGNAGGVSGVLVRACAAARVAQQLVSRGWRAGRLRAGGAPASPAHPRGAATCIAQSAAWRCRARRARALQRADVYVCMFTPAAAWASVARAAVGAARGTHDAEVRARHAAPGGRRGRPAARQRRSAQQRSSLVRLAAACAQAAARCNASRRGFAQNASEACTRTRVATTQAGTARGARQVRGNTPREGTRRGVGCCPHLRTGRHLSDSRTRPVQVVPHKTRPLRYQKVPEKRVEGSGRRAPPRNFTGRWWVTTRTRCARARRGAGCACARAGAPRRPKPSGLRRWSLLPRAVRFGIVRGHAQQMRARGSAR